MDREELESSLKDLLNRETALKIKIHQSRSMITTIEGFISKNLEMLQTNFTRLKKTKEDDLISIEEYKKIRDNIGNIEKLIDVQVERKANLFSDITSSQEELVQLSSLILEIKEDLDRSKCIILEFPNEKKQA